MRRSVLAALLLPLLAGCLTSAPQAPKYWMLSWYPTRSEAAVSRPMLDATVRVSLLDVCAPYSGTRLSVLRPDGSIAFDDFNSFATSPAAILRGVTLDCVAASGYFAHVVPSSSAARTPYILEVTVGELALDCRIPDARSASVCLKMTLLEDRHVKALSSGDASVRMSDDNFAAAFDRAYAQAIRSALAGLFAK